MYNEYSIIFVDIYMEGIDGVEIAHTIHSSNKDCLIIFLLPARMICGGQLRRMPVLIIY